MTWEEPTSPNGEIINYISVNDGAIIRERSGMGTKFDVTGLEPYTNYSVKVQACTSEGCGPFSNEMMNTTLQDGDTHIIKIMYIIGVCIILVTSCWLPPPPPPFPPSPLPHFVVYTLVGNFV